jgi:hypothetical protein
VHYWGDDEVKNLLSASCSVCHVSPDRPGMSPTHPPGANEKDRVMIPVCSGDVFDDEGDEGDEGDVKRVVIGFVWCGMYLVC